MVVVVVVVVGVVVVVLEVDTSNGSRVICVRVVCGIILQASKRAVWTKDVLDVLPCGDVESDYGRLGCSAVR